MKLKLNRNVIFPSRDELVVGSLGEPLAIEKDANGNVIAFDMIFYGYPRIFKNVRAQDLEMLDG